MKVYFLKYDKQDVYGHTLNVIEELYNIQQQFGYIEEGSEVACYCHDLGRVVQNNHIIRFCIENNIHICEEEKQVPSILHQKVSAFIAEKVFNIKNRIILEAIGYHTTSRKNPSITEIEVFLADKLSWKADWSRKLVREIREALKDSKEKAIFHYLSYLNSNKENLQLFHKDSMEAYYYFKRNNVNEYILK